MKYRGTHGDFHGCELLSLENADPPDFGGEEVSREKRIGPG
jgi:hypothetical protein